MLGHSLEFLLYAHASTSAAYAPIAAGRYSSAQPADPEGCAEATTASAASTNTRFTGHCGCQGSAEMAAGVQDPKHLHEPGQEQLPAAPRRPRVLLGVTGSVAAIKVPLLAPLLGSFADVRVVSTHAARCFFKAEDLPGSMQPVLGDEDEWHEWSQMGDPVMHIELRRWADALVVAPLSANSLAKMAHGLADNLLTCIVRAWDFTNPLVVAPAMNTFMWDSPFTSQQLAVLQGMGARVVPPVAKRLACGDVGTGAMATPEDIAGACAEALRGRPGLVFG